MASVLRLPGVSADADEAVVDAWVVAEGEEVAAGDVLANVETDKAVVELPADEAGTVYALLVPDGATVPVGDPIAVLLAPGEDATAGAALLSSLGLESDTAATATTAAAGEPDPLPDPDRAPAPAGAPSPVSSPAPSAPAAPASPPPQRDATADGRSGRIFVSPLVRRLAREHDVDVATLTGSGPGGRIVRRDLEAHLASAQAAEAMPTAAQPPPAPPSAPTTASGDGTATFEEIPHTPLRRTLARRLQASVQQAPHFRLHVTIDAAPLVALRAQVNDTGDMRVSVNDLIVQAVGRALLDEPDMNVQWTEDAVRRFSRADVAVAVATDRGLLTPVVRDVGARSLTETAAVTRTLVTRAQAGQLRPDELEGGTFTVSNLGMFGIEDFDAIINPPQAGILAVGALRQAPVVAADGGLTVGTVLSLTLSADHRPVDGAVAARWFGRLRELLEHPVRMLI